jgi:hypothetical protein
MCVSGAQILVDIAVSDLPETFLLVEGTPNHALAKIFTGVEVNMSIRFLEEADVLFLNVESVVDETAVALYGIPRRGGW